MPIPRFAAATLPALFTGFLVGCNGGGGSSSGTDATQSPPVTDDPYFQQAMSMAAQYPAMPRNSVEVANLNGAGAAGFASGTPFNDLAYTLYDVAYIEGETNGYDTFFPVDPSTPSPGSDTVRLVRAVNNLDLEAAYDGAEGDRIILGTAEFNQPFFLRGADGVDNDYAVLQNYDYNHGHIQLNGSRDDYYLLRIDSGSANATPGYYLFYIDGQTLDLVAFIFHCDDPGDTISGVPPRDDTVLCNASRTLALDDGVNFRFATTQHASPPIAALDAVQFGTHGKQIVAGIVSDSNGSTYTFGATDNSLGMGPGDDNRAFVIQHHADGSRGWLFELPLPDGTLLFDAAADDTYLYAVGRTLGALPGFTNQGRWDAIMLKLRLSDGALVASHQYGQSGLDGYGNVALDDNGNLFVSGAGSPSGATDTDEAHLVAKHRQSDLSTVWRVVEPPDAGGVIISEAWGGLSYFPGATPGDGRLLAAGWFMSAGGADSFISVYESLNDSAPQRVASAVIQSPGQQADWILDNVFDSSGNIYVAGYTTGALGQAQLGDGDAFIAKYDANLQNPIFVQVGTAQSDMFRKLEITASDTLFAVGYTYGDYQGINPNSEKNTGDVLIQTFDSNLTPGTAAQLGGSGEERGYIDFWGSRVYVGGMTESSFMADKHGAFDGFVVPIDIATLNYLN